MATITILFVTIVADEFFFSSFEKYFPNNGLIISAVIDVETDWINPSSVEIPAEINPNTTINPM